MNCSALDLGTISIWSAAVRSSPDRLDVVREVEELGFETLWIPGGIDNGVLTSLDELLSATSTLNLATGIINIWKHEPSDLAAWWAQQPPDRQSRLFLGLGVSHGSIIGESWNRPVAKMREFLDGLSDMPANRLCLAALGPRMLELATQRTAGAHPYMVTPRHTAFARQMMGPRAILAPEQSVVLEPDRDKARDIARGMVRHYARLPNYTNNWRRDGFTDQDIAQLSDRLVSDLVVWEGMDAIADRVEQHRVAGANHVCLQVVSPGGMASDLGQERTVWRELARLL